MALVRIFHQLGNCKQLNSPHSGNNISSGGGHIQGGGLGGMPSIVLCPPTAPPQLETLHRVTDKVKNLCRFFRPLQKSVTPSPEKFW